MNKKQIIQEIKKQIKEVKRENNAKKGIYSLSEIREVIIKAKSERDNIKSLNTKLRTKEQEARLKELNELISNAEIKLRIETETKKINKMGLKLVGNSYNGFSLKEEINPFPTKTIKRPKMTTNKLNELVPLRKNGKIVYETVQKKLYRPLKCIEKNGSKTWIVPKGYNKRVLAQAKINSDRTQIIETKINNSKVTLLK